MSVMGSSQGSSEQKLTLTAADNGTLTISMPSLGLGAMAMPAFDITGVSDLTGTINDGQMKLTMNIKPGAMPMAITFTFDTQDTTQGE